MKTENKPALPRTDVQQRQKERVRKVLELDKESLNDVRGGSARYGLPPPPPTDGSTVDSIS